jgi:hypothetical protein
MEDDSKGPPFKFNCIHDLESTWWIALWVLTHHTPLPLSSSSTSTSSEHNTEIQKIHATTLFPPIGWSSIYIRACALLQGATIREIIPSLHPSFHHAAERLLDARRLLVRRYKIAEAGPAINEDAFEGVHRELGDIWRGCRDEFGDVGYRWVWESEHGLTNDPGSFSEPESKKLRIR